MIPTVPARSEMFTALLDRVLPQTEPFDGAVKVQAFLNDGGQGSIGQVRDAMVEQAWKASRTGYVSFIDDDDMVSRRYVDKILTALAVWPHTMPPGHVGFKVEVTKNGKLWTEGTENGIIDHSLKWKKWGYTNGGMRFRDFTHIDPIRTAIARQGKFADAEPGEPEDRAWVRQVRPLLAGPSTEAYIDEVLYYYQWRPAASISAPGVKLGIGNPWPGGHPAETHRNFYWHPESL